ncbi:MAG: HAD-IC family P-type ATPase [Patescibacteria group bacterium]|jgi:Ca2+-transporting ATPase
MAKNLWHALSETKVLNLLKTDKNGLSQIEAEKRIKEFGFNQLPEKKKETGLVIFLRQFKSPLVYVLLGAAVISFILQDFIDMAVILVTVLVNIILGFYQENRAYRAIYFLKKLIEFKSKIWRDGRIIEIEAVNLVPGDIILLKAGDKIPADCRLLNLDNFLVNEATLTGESIPLEKSLAALGKGAVLAERKNMVYSGTIVARGKATAIVCETGTDTELGQITQLVGETEKEKTPLQLQLEIFSRYLVYAVLGICAILIAIGKLQGRTIFGFGQAAREGMLNVAAAIAVAAIPEGLSISVTVILAIGMQEILKRKSLARNLAAAETLGSVSIICTDKTGTLTEGKMQVAKIITPETETNSRHLSPYVHSNSLVNKDLILKMSLLCSDAVLENPQAELEEQKIIGDPTETALLSAALQNGIPYQQIHRQQPRLAEIPFDSQNKYMATLNQFDPGHSVIYVKGAPEKIFSMLSEIRMNDRKESIDGAKLKSLKSRYEKLTARGLRVLAFAYKKISSSKEPKIEEELNDLIFVGFVALHDPLRPETKDTIKLAAQAGIRTIMVTGDHKLTAKAIYKELGFDISEKNILEGHQLEQLSDSELAKIVEKIDIYARVEPHHKLRIVDAWQKKGEVVAMTGDGVNDAAAIKSADIGIALGSGTDVAKETSDLVLLDNNFKTIIAAVERGRIIFDNIRKSILYLLSDSFSEIILISGALILGLPLPLLPIQIIWVNMIDDGLPSLALTLEKGDENVMSYKPRRKKEKILDSEMKILIFGIGTMTNLILLGLFYYLFKTAVYDLIHIRTLLFSMLGVESLLYVFSCRNLRQSIFKSNHFSNPYLVGAVLIGLGLQLIAIYQPYLQRIFETVSLGLNDWLIIIALNLIQLAGIELVKYYFIVKKYNTNRLTV